MNRLQSRVLFAKWLKKNDPFLFEVAKKKAIAEKSMSVSGVGFLPNIDWADLAKSAISTVKDIAPAVVQYKAQSSILKTQLKRAEQGLPPLETSQYAPTVKVAAEITPEMEASAERIAHSSIGVGIERLLPMIAIGSAAFFLLTRKKGRR